MQLKNLKNMPVAFSDEIEAGMQQFDVEMLYFVT
jgi:hypothetical protein